MTFPTIRGEGHCETCRAANALQDACSESHCMASLDADLQRIIAASSVLPVAIKAAVVAILELQPV